MSDANLYDLTGDPRDDIDTDFLLFTIAIHTRDRMALSQLLHTHDVDSLSHPWIYTFLDLECSTADAKAGQDESVLYLLSELWRHWMDATRPTDVPDHFDVTTIANVIGDVMSAYGWGESIEWLWENVIKPVDAQEGTSHHYAVEQALWHGIEGNHYSVVQWAIKNGAPVDKPREDGEYPITLACKCRADAAVELLLEAECDLMVTDPHGTTASDLLAAYEART